MAASGISGASRVKRILHLRLVHSLRSLEVCLLLSVSLAVRGARAGAGALGGSHGGVQRVPGRRVGVKVLVSTRVRQCKRRVGNGTTVSTEWLNILATPTCSSPAWAPLAPGNYSGPAPWSCSLPSLAGGTGSTGR